jgi:hypothetical protein
VKTPMRTVTWAVRLRASGADSDGRGDGVPDNHGDARGILEKARNYSSDRVARVFWQC